MVGDATIILRLTIWKQGATVGYQTSYGEVPGLGDRVFELLELPFPGVTGGRRNGEAFGVPWETCSTPFVAWDEGRVVCHVGLLDLPIHVMGRDHHVGGVHGVATHPDYRRRGLFRGAIEELFEHAAGRFETLVLTTLHPEYFAPFGFRVVPEFVHRAAPVAAASVPDARSLDLTRPDDLRLLHGLIERRAPISRYLGVGAEKACFGFVEYQTAIRYSAGLDAAVVFERAGGWLRLYDVVGSRIPSLPEIIGLTGGPVEHILAFFSPDRVAGRFAAEPHDLEGGPDALEPGTMNWVFMVRGPFAAMGHPVMLPRPTRC
ncbi:MAG: GNAT family N-acetyltransferase [Gemmatimonadales bacterium]